MDSVINSGKSIADHVNHIRTFNLAARIVIIAGVVQEQAIQKETGGLSKALLGYGRLSTVALRTSTKRIHLAVAARIPVTVCSIPPTWIDEKREQDV